MNLTILYRGYLESCNYDCGYCPFAKRRETTATRIRDKAGLASFLVWVRRSTDVDLTVFFTPWGEALVTRRYQQAMVALSREQHVRKVMIQTNLSGSLRWLDQANTDSLRIWATFHPGQTTLKAFVERCHLLDEKGVRHCVGIVGSREHFDWAQRLRAALPSHTYMWINALQPMPRGYSEDEIRFCEALDPHFRLNLARHASRGKACRTGSEVISVNGDGEVRRCHFWDEKLGNLYQQNLREILTNQPCPRGTCACHLGYVHLREPAVDAAFGSGALERIPDIWPEPPVAHVALG